LKTHKMRKSSPVIRGGRPLPPRRDRAWSPRAIGPRFRLSSRPCRRAPHPGEDRGGAGHRPPIARPLVALLEQPLMSIAGGAFS
jgi:hypothetical protein